MIAETQLELRAMFAALVCVAVAVLACGCKRSSNGGTGDVDPALTHAADAALAMQAPDSGVDAGSVVSASQVDAVEKRTQAAYALLEKAKAWTDPDAIHSIELACDVNGGSPVDFTAPPLSCRLAWNQSCSTYNPCETPENACNEVCGKACGTCDDSCVASCVSCKTTCSGDAGACEHACAKSTATCRQACLKTRDRCATSGCARAAIACATEQSQKWKRNGCTGKCPAIAKCNSTCEAPACFAACDAKFPGCDKGWCIAGNSRGLVSDEP